MKVLKVWTTAEIQFLRENYKAHGGDYVADALGRSLNSVRIQAFYLNQSRPHARHKPLERVKAMMRGTEAEPQTPAVSSSPAVIVTDFIRPIPMARLMAGRA